MIPALIILTLLGCLVFVKFFTSRIHYEKLSDSNNTFSFKVNEQVSRTANLKIAEFLFEGNDVWVSVEYVGHNQSVADLKDIDFSVHELTKLSKQKLESTLKYVKYKDIVPMGLKGTKELGTINPREPFSELANPIEFFKNDSNANYCFTVVRHFQLKKLPAAIEIDVKISNTDKELSFSCNYKLEVEKLSILDFIKGTKLKDIKY